jgi:hypothetical protein
VIDAASLADLTVTPVWEIPQHEQQGASPVGVGAAQPVRAVRARRAQQRVFPRPLADVCRDFGEPSKLGGRAAVKAVSEPLSVLRVDEDDDRREHGAALMASAYSALCPRSRQRRGTQLSRSARDEAACICSPILPRPVDSARLNGGDGGCRVPKLGVKQPTVNEIKERYTAGGVARDNAPRARTTPRR